MADIELVIRIPEDEYQNILLTGKASFRTVNAIEAGTLLPKCHGRLIDADELKDDLPDDDRLSDMVMSHNEGVLEYQTKLSLLPPVQPKQRTGYISIDDVMSVFDDFMCGEVDEDGTDTFLEMLKDKAEGSEE